MIKRVHDNRPFYCPRKERVYDPEWIDAENADEPMVYYWQEMYNGGKCVKLYKPSVAILYSKRSGLKTVPVNRTYPLDTPKNQ